MNIRNLESFVEQENRWSAVFNGPQLSLLNAKDRQKIAQAIDSRLSPENLSCDGELPRGEVQRRYTFLTRCADELRSIDPSVVIYEY